MKIHRSLLFMMLFLVSFLSFAQEPLKVGVERFAPPFVVVGANATYGFDADMMKNLCERMDRSCVFEPLPFSELINAAAHGETDVSLSAIAITPERLKMVNFSLPYLILYHRFLTRKGTLTEPFSFDLLSNKRIGYESGTILGQRIETLPITNPRLVPFKNIQDEVLALSEGQVDFIILDNPTALYWQANSVRLVTIGPALPSPYALGIAVNPNDNDLLIALNKALEGFMSDGSFERYYNKYLSSFSKSGP